MDIVMSHQAGYSNTVATSGTALTPNQIDQLKRISNNIVVAYDADEAGMNASEKVWKLALSRGMDVKVAEFPEGDDPAEIIKVDSLKWKEIIKKSYEKNKHKKIYSVCECGGSYTGLKNGNRFIRHSKTKKHQNYLL